MALYFSSVLDATSSFDIRFCYSAIDDVTLTVVTVLCIGSMVMRVVLPAGPTAAPSYKNRSKMLAIWDGPRVRSGGGPTWLRYTTIRKFRSSQVKSNKSKCHQFLFIFSILPKIVKDILSLNCGSVFMRLILIYFYSVDLTVTVSSSRNVQKALPYSSVNACVLPFSEEKVRVK